MRKLTKVALTVGMLFGTTHASFAYYVMTFAGGCERYCSSPWTQGSNGNFSCSGSLEGSCGCLAIAAPTNGFVPLVSPTNENIKGTPVTQCKAVKKGIGNNLKAIDAQKATIQPKE